MNKDIIVVENLTKKFNGLTAVDNISFTVKKGEVFAFLGPNGAGKSTTIKMLTTLRTPTAGKILVDGKNPVTEKDAVRELIGLVFQDPSLDDELTGWENLEFHGILYKIPKEIRRQKIEEMLKLVELWDRRNSLVKTFSGGMKRRLEIARGLMHQPKILFLDEPTIGLDPQTRLSIWKHIKEMNQKNGVTVFLTTHYLEEAEKMANQIAIIDHGKIVSSGTAEELKKQTGTKTLEEAFIKLTGETIRPEDPSLANRLGRGHHFHR